MSADPWDDCQIALRDLWLEVVLGEAGRGGSAAWVEHPRAHFARACIRPQGARV